MTSMLSQVISDLRLITTLEPRTRMTPSSHVLDSKSQRFPDFQPWAWGTLKLWNHPLFRTRAGMGQSSGNKARGLDPVASVCLGAPSA